MRVVSDQPPPPPPPSYGQYEQYGAPQMAAGPANVDNFGRPLAEWWKRLVALIIDGFVLAVPAIVIFVILGAGFAATSSDRATTSEGFDALFGTGILAATGLTALASLAYYALLNGGEKGQTLGKMALKIQVRDEQTGGAIGYGRGFLRHVLQAGSQFASCIGLVFIIIDGLFPLWDPKRQAIHDKIAKSVVIDVSQR